MGNQLKLDPKSDPKGYYAYCKELRDQIESDPAVWDKWTKSEKRYMLVASISLTERDWIVEDYDHFDLNISSDSIHSLRRIWGSFLKKRISIKTTPFIVDIHDKKVVQSMAVVCM